MPTSTVPQKRRTQFYNVKVVLDKDLKDKLRRISFWRDESYSDILKRCIEKEFALASRAWQRSTAPSSSSILPE